jgi:hypothetical protein
MLAVEKIVLNKPDQGPEKLSPVKSAENPTKGALMRLARFRMTLQI